MSVEIDSLCDFSLKDLDENGCCPGCHISPSDQIVEDEHKEVDIYILNQLIHEVMRKISERLPQLLQISAPYFKEKNRRGAWIMLHESAYELKHQRKVKFSTLEELNLFPDQFHDTKELIARYNPAEEIVVCCLVEQREPREEEQRSSPTEDYEEEEFIERKREEDVEPAPGTAYGLSLIMSLPAIQRAHEAVEKLRLARERENATEFLVTGSSFSTPSCK